MVQSHNYNYCKQGIRIGIAFTWLFTGCVTPLINQQTLPTQNLAIQPDSPLSGIKRAFTLSSSYVYIDFADMVDTSEAIIVGKVKSISRAQWNQDSGEYWDSDEDPADSASFVIHYVEIEIARSLVNAIKLESPIKIPVISEQYVLDEKNNLVEEIKRPP